MWQTSLEARKTSIVVLAVLQRYVQQTEYVTASMSMLLEILTPVER